jgi:hypothetical protein
MTPSINDLTTQLSQMQINTHTFVLFPKVQYAHSMTFWNLVQSVLTQNVYKGHVSIPGSGIFNREVLQFFLRHNICCEVPKICRIWEKIKALDLPNAQSTPLSQAHVAAITDSDAPVLPKDLETIDAKGRTPLQICAILDHRIAAKHLIEHGANPERCTQFHGSAIGLAAQRKFTALLHIFRAKKALIACNVFSTYQSDILQKGVSTAFQVEQVATALFGIVHRRKPGSIELFKKACSWHTDSSQFLKNYYESETVRRLVCHSFDIDWSLPYGKNGIITPVITHEKGAESRSFYPLSGGFAPFFLNEMKESTLAFLRCFTEADVIECRIVKKLKYTLELVSSQPTTPIADVFARWKNQLPTFISVEFDNPAHSVMVMLFKQHFIICNRGCESRKAVEVFRFDKKCLKESDLVPLFTRFSGPEAYKKYFFTDLVKTLNMEKNPMETALEHTLDLPCQEIGNCAWKSPETCVYTYFLFTLLDINKLLVDSVFTMEQAEYHQGTANIMFNNWLYDQKLTYLGRYLKNLHQKDQHFFANYEPLDSLKKGYNEIAQYCLLYPEIEQKALELKSKYCCLQ